MAGTQISLITSVAITFVLTLFVLVSMISILRRRRDAHEQKEISILAAMLDVTQPTEIVREVTRPMAAIDDELIKPPAEVVFSPYRNLTREQRNIRKLVAFLKEEAIQNHLIQDSVPRAS